MSAINRLNYYILASGLPKKLTAATIANYLIKNYKGKKGPKTLSSKYDRDKTVLVTLEAKAATEFEKLLVDWEKEKNIYSNIPYAYIYKSKTVEGLEILVTKNKDQATVRVIEPKDINKVARTTLPHYD